LGLFFAIELVKFRCVLPETAVMKGNPMFKLVKTIILFIGALWLGLTAAARADYVTLDGKPVTQGQMLIDDTGP
jgi:hypothetical protein